MEKEEFITITHFINPQLFWYHKVDGQNPEMLEAKRIEASVQSLYTAKQSAAMRAHRPHVGEIVAVAYVSWNKFIRARVVDVVKFLKAPEEYIVWALDYGFPFQTKMSNIRELPSSNIELSDHIRVGAIADVIPAELDFDLITRTSQLVSKPIWPQRCVEMLEKVLNDAASISFIESFTMDGESVPQKQQFGDLKVIAHSGAEFFVSDYLIKLNYAISCKEGFRKKITTLNTNKIPCWQTNTRDVKIIHNKLNALNIEIQGKFDLSGSISEASCDTIAKQKVMDWCERNQNDNKITEDLVTQGLVFPKSSFDASDISFDDSISVQQDNEQEFDETVMGFAGRIHESRRKKYAGKTLPPMPSLAVFQVIPENKNNHETKSNVSAESLHSFKSSRAKKLMEARKQHLAKIQAQKDQVIPSKELSQLRVNSPSETGTDEFLEKCKMKNAQGFQELNELIDTNSQESFPLDCIPKFGGPESIPTSTMSKKKLQLMKIRQQQQAEKKMDKSESTIDMHTLEDKTDSMSQTDSKVSAYVQNLINKRNKILQQKQSEQSAIDSSFETSAAPIRNTTKGYKMPQHSAKFNRLDFGHHNTDNAPELTKDVQKVDEKLPGEDLETSKDERGTQKTVEEIRKLVNEDPFSNMTMVPAGFDVTKLVKRRDESNHWHTKKTTVNDPIHSNYSANKNKTFEVPTENFEEDFFRLTSSRKERKKKDESHLLDMSLNDTGCPPAITPEILNKETFDCPISDDSNMTSKLVDISGDDKALNQSVSSDSFFREMEEMNSVRDTSRQKLLETTSNATSDDSTEIATKATKKHLTQKKTDYIQSNCSNSSMSSSSFTKLEIPEEESKPCSNKGSDYIDRSYEASTSSIASVLEENEKTQLNTSPKVIEFSVPKTAKFTNLPEVSGEATLKTNFIQHLVLAHSEGSVAPIERMKNALFSAEIHQEMEHMRLTKLYRIQSYAWSHLVRGNCFCVINSTRTGKTWCYMPPICSMLSYRIEAKSILQTYGPAVIIIAPSSVQVESITRHCRRLLASTTPKVNIVPAYGFRNTDEVKIELHNGCGMLVITPPCLERLLEINEKEPLLNMKRIQALVIDGLDSIMGENPDFDEILHRLVSPILPQQTDSKLPFQLVITSKRWTRRLINLLKIANQPLLCIADYLEAAVYAKAKLSIKLQSKSEKMAVVMKCLDKCSYAHERTIVLCNKVEDVMEVEASLRESGYMCMAYTERMPAENADMITEWKQKAICNQVLITSDSVLPELKIQNVWTLIHYSMPMSWTKFNFRFSVFLNNYENSLVTGFQKATKSPKSLILLDEENNLQLPRLIEFMKTHNQVKHIHPDILNVAARVTADLEEARVNKGVLMCPKVLEFGSCDEKNRCQHRHQLTKFDGPAEGIPKHGEIRVKILDVLSPTHYIARLLSHKHSQTWETVRRSNEYAMFPMKLSVHFIKEERRIIHWPLRVNDICVYKDGDNYHRCLLLEVPPIQYESVVKLVNVKVKLIDSGSCIMCKSHDLLVIPEDFKNFPAQAVDIRLSGILPFDNERVWDSRSTRTIKKWIMTDVTNKDVLQASINFVLMDTIWVNNVILMEQLPAICGYALKINVRRSLLGRGFAQANDEMHTIKQTAMQIGLLKDTSNLTVAQFVEEEENLLEFSAASSDEKHVNGDCNELKPPLEAQTKKEISCSSPIAQKQAKKKSVAADEEATEDWASLAIDELAQVKIEQLNDQCEFYIRLMEKEADLRDLDDLIRSETKLPLKDPHPMNNCLVPLNGRFHRAKIQRVIVNSTEGSVEARVFFCDTGYFCNIPLAQLRASSTTIIEFIPFQAICCKLTGIHMESKHEEIKKFLQFEDSVHLAYAVKERTSIKGEFSIRNYDVILYECFTDKKDIQINKMLVEEGFARYDDETKHFLELETEVDFDNENFNFQEQNSYDFQGFLDRIKEQMDEEDEEFYKMIEKTPEEKNKIVEITQDTCDDSVELPKSTNDEEIDSERLPPLQALHKRPSTTWHETMCMIYLVIHAPDITDYHLEVGSKSLVFVATVNNEPNVLILNFLGYIQPELVTHEIRGLNVVVRLVKSLYMKWPRLLQDPTKFSWLNYNYNAIDLLEEEEMFGRTSRTKKRIMSCSSNSSTDSDSNPCETFTPIVNVDQLHDPMQDIC